MKCQTWQESYLHAPDIILKNAIYFHLLSLVTIHIFEDNCTNDNPEKGDIHSISHKKTLKWHNNKCFLLTLTSNVLWKFAVNEK